MLLGGEKFQKMQSERKKKANRTRSKIILPIPGSTKDSKLFHEKQIKFPSKLRKNKQQFKTWMIVYGA